MLRINIVRFNKVLLLVLYSSLRSFDVFSSASVGVLMSVRTQPQYLYGVPRYHHMTGFEPSRTFDCVAILPAQNFQILRGPKQVCGERSNFYFAIFFKIYFEEFTDTFLTS